MTTHDELKTLPVLPLKNTVLFPGLMLPLSVGRKSTQAAVDAAEGCRRRGLHRRRRGGRGDGEVRRAELDHALLHGRRHGVERFGKRSGAVSAIALHGGEEVAATRFTPARLIVRGDKDRATRSTLVESALRAVPSSAIFPNGPQTE